MMCAEYQAEDWIEGTHNIEYQFIPSSNGMSPVHQNNQRENPESKNLSSLRNGSGEEIYVSLQLGEPEAKRRKQSDSLFSIEASK
ncbi:hypothetical protein SLEP1_g44964 [Rubroshorea leprosula]|uniref:Uncharacterized protein n=1 Tax=Rubroshorea leprosula TaxID=152421 RepID=A0AAV5LHY4_9ROSI|nr:hypothetical protein SLEP1_g44964 [Rubroshorea leprosula]